MGRLGDRDLAVAVRVDRGQCGGLGHRVGHDVGLGLAVVVDAVAVDVLERRRRVDEDRVRVALRGGANGQDGGAQRRSGHGQDQEDRA